MEYIPSFRDGLRADIKPSYLMHTMMDEEFETKKFGLPKVKKFPMPDAAHVKSAIKFFNYAKPSQEQELADAILARMEEYGIDPDSLNVGDENRFKKYLEKSYLEHHGILGQRWGVRRFQNKDGSYTSTGKSRYTKKATKNQRLSKMATYGRQGSMDQIWNTAKKRYAGEKVGNAVGKSFVELAMKRNPNLKISDDNYRKLIKQAERFGAKVGTSISRIETLSGYYARSKVGA